MHVVEASPFHELHVFVTGMHMLKLYGSTYVEVVKDGYQHIHPFVNQHVREPMESIFGNTISGLSRWVRGDARARTCERTHECKHRPPPLAACIFTSE